MAGSNSSFYLNGTAYSTLANADVLLATINADLAMANTAASNASASATSAAASALAAAAVVGVSLLSANNLSDLASIPTAVANLGLGNVTNTSDANKPVSTAQATADALVASNAAAATALKAPLASPTFTGVPSGPTAAPSTNSTQLATTAYADAIGALAASALSLTAPKASPTFTGVPAGPTAAPLSNSTQLATTAYDDAANAALSASLTSAIALKASLASPAFSGVPTAPTAAAGTNTTQLATTAFALSNCVLIRTTQIKLYVSPSGSNSNDGLTTGTPMLTLQAAVNRAYSVYYTCNMGSIIIDGISNTFQEFVQVFYPLNGGGTLLFQNLTWKPANSSYALMFGDNALVGLTNVTFSTVGTTTPVGLVVGHQEGVLDVNTGVVITPTIALSGDVFTSDGLTHFNINNGLTINAGTISGMIYRSVWASAPCVGKASFNIQGAHTYNGTLSIGRFAWASLCTSMCLAGSVTHTATGSLTCGVSLVNQNAVMQNLGAALPGGAPTPTTGGQYVTATLP